MRFCFHTFMPMKQNISFAGFRLSQAVLTFVMNYSAVIWQNPISSQLHFSGKSRFSFQVFLRMFLIVDFFNFWFDKSA